MEKFEIERKVTEDMLAVSVGSGSLRVLATPVVIAMVEEASAKLAQTLLSDDMTTVGTNVTVNHLSPTPLGAVVRAVSKLKRNIGRTFEFDVIAYDNDGEIARGTHTRVSVYSEKFQNKADSKIDN
ncbi:MAG: thioesterase family protein [Ruminococcus sp.]|nr:thioesterase family protein [Ruminococcus sp.]